MNNIVKKMVLAITLFLFISNLNFATDIMNEPNTKLGAIYHNVDAPNDLNPIKGNKNNIETKTSTSSDTKYLSNEKKATNSDIISTNSNATLSTSSNILLATDSQIFIHDGIKYIKGELVGEFKLTGYCACTKCTNGSGYTYSGKPVRENHTVAADRKILPIGTFIVLEGSRGWDTESYNGVYQVEDIGGGVKDKHIDIYRPTHDLAAYVTYYGYNYANVYIAIPIE